MASIYRRPKSPFWWVKFRDHDGKIARISAGTESEEVAQRFAAAAEKLSRVALENPGPVRTAAIRQLAELGVLQSGEEVLAGPPPKPEDDPLDLLQLADAHPMVQTEKRDHPGAYRYHKKLLEQFVNEAGISTLSKLTPEAARAYLARLVKAKMTAEQVRHRLYFLRAAGNMAAERGHGNPLLNLKIPRAVAQARVERTLTMAEVAKVLASGLPQRVRIIVALQALMGLRLSEVTRLWWVDLRGDLLHVGARVAKTADSNRLLPMPPTIQAWIEELRAHRQENGWTSRLMLTHIRAAQSTSLDMRRTGFAVARAIREATDDKELVPKVLRKSFATIAVWEVGMPPEVVESFMGRKISTLGSTTARHYLGKAHADRLRPWAVKVDEALRAHRLGTPAAED